MRRSTRSPQARIAHDHPDILADMRAGKYRSVRAAAIDAGIIDPDCYQVERAAAVGYMGTRLLTVIF